MRKIVEQIHQSQKKFAIAITGGGSQVISELLKYGGASTTLVDASIPYSTEALKNYLHYEPQKYCSEETARLMAVVSRDRCNQFTQEETGIGFGITCSLAKSNERTGREHWIHMAICQADSTHSFSAKINGQREEEEEWASLLILEMIAFYTLSNFIPANLFKLPQRKSSSVWKTSDPYIELSLNPTKNTNFIFPGSFNPIHDSHVSMCEYVFNKKHIPVNLEISIQNVDKPSIDHISAEDRVANIIKLKNLAINKVLLTKSPKFYQKAQLFPNSTFIVGIDTYNRIVDKNYYKNKDEFERAIDIISYNNCNFLVFNRKGYSLNDNANIINCEFVTDYTDTDISSSKIRKSKNGNTSISH